MTKRPQSTAPTVRTAVGYVRISKETEASTSPERQRADIERLCASRGWDLVAVEEDLDISGTSLDGRPGLERAITSGADALVVYRLDRMSRSAADFHGVLERLTEARCVFVSATEPLDFSTPMGAAMGGIVAIFAELESATIGARVKSSQKHLARVGRWRGGRRPFGWEPVPHPSGAGLWLAAHPVEAPILRDLAERAADGENLLSLCRDLVRRGVPSLQGNTWAHTSLRGMLVSPRLIGQGIDPETRSVALDESGLPASYCEPLIDASLFARVVAAIDTASRPIRRHHETSGPLQGIAECGLCGRPMYHHESGGRRSYRCASYAISDRGGCEGTSMKAEWMERAVETEFLAAVGRFPVSRVVEEIDAASDDRLRLMEALDRLEDDRYRLGLFSGPEGDARYVTAHGRISSALEALGPATAVRVIVEDLGITFGEAWAADEAARPRLLARALESVIIHPPTLSFRIYDPSRVELRWAEGNIDPEG